MRSAIFRLAATTALLVVVSVACEAIAEVSRAEGAYRACVSGAQRHLLAPTTARFASFEDSSVWDEGDDLIVSTYVDAQNAFGVPIRKSFECYMGQDTAGRWKIDSLPRFFE